MLKTEPEKILSSIGQGVVVFDGQGHVTYMNPHASLLLDYTSEELLGKPIDKFFPLSVGKEGEPPEEGISETVLEAHQPISSAMYQDTLYLSSQSGSKFPVYLVGTPILLGDKPEGGIVIFRDITEEEEKRTALLKAQSQIATINKELESKVSELERLNRFMVGRELRMIELKKQVKDLEDRLAAIHAKTGRVNAKEQEAFK